MKAIADTGFLVAFGNRRDLHHTWALQIAQRVTEPLLSCEAVLAETGVSFGQRSAGPGLHAKRIRYADRAPDLGDLCLIRLSELHPVITTDMVDFRIYRRGRRETIPLITPPLLAA